MSLTATQVAQTRVEVAKNMGTTVAVETFSGESGVGPIYAASANVTCGVSTTRRLVRNADGEEVVSERTLYVASTDEAKFTPNSRITIATLVSTVIAVSPKEYKGQVTHVEVACT